MYQSSALQAGAPARSCSASALRALSAFNFASFLQITIPVPHDNTVSDKLRYELARGEDARDVMQ
ncbi:hypothetical protein N9K47_00210 [bacterium]|nr:hypothetical protein [bacterium]